MFECIAGVLCHVNEFVEFVDSGDIRGHGDVDVAVEASNEVFLDPDIVGFISEL